MKNFEFIIILFYSNHTSTDKNISEASPLWTCSTLTEYANKQNTRGKIFSFLFCSSTISTRSDVARKKIYIKYSCTTRSSSKRVKSFSFLNSLSCCFPFFHSMHLIFYYFNIQQVDQKSRTSWMNCKHFPFIYTLLSLMQLKIDI